MRSDLSDSLVKALMVVASQPRRRASPYAALLERATAAATPVAELAAIKEQAKGFLKEATGRRRREAATLLYHVAVAAAFVHHDAAISGRPAHKQLPVYQRFADAWGERPIGGLFREAVRRITEAGPGA